MVSVAFFSDLVTFYLWSKGVTLLQHEIAFRALSLRFVRVDGVSSLSVFHYSFSPNPPPIIPVTSNTILVVLWRSIPLTARKLLDHRETSSWRPCCVFIPSMQSCTAARHIIYCMTGGLRFSSRGGRITSSSPTHRDDQVLVCCCVLALEIMRCCLCTICQTINFLLICELLYSKHEICTVQSRLFLVAVNRARCHTTWLGHNLGQNCVVAVGYPFAPEHPHSPHVRFWSDTGKWGCC